MNEWNFINASDSDYNHEVSEISKQTENKNCRSNVNKECECEKVRECECECEKNKKWK